MSKNLRLFSEFAGRYDLHTPPDLFLPDHELVLDELSRFGAGARILDVGCGTGVFLKSAREAGFEAVGIDAAPEMIAVTERRLGPGIARVRRLQDVDETEAYDAIVSLSFPLNYCAGVGELRESLARFHRALRPGGLLLLQVAHAANASGFLMEDWQPGPGGERDVQLLFRFSAVPGGEPRVRAQYVYSCRSLHELCSEDHLLNVADVHLVADLLRETGFTEIRIYNDGRREPLTNAVAPFVMGVK